MGLLWIGIGCIEYCESSLLCVKGGVAMANGNMSCFFFNWQIVGKCKVFLCVFQWSLEGVSLVDEQLIAVF